MNDRDLKTLLAEAESHYTRYEWDEAIARFEAVLAEHANHGAAAQGLAGAKQQKQVEAELAATIAEARAALDRHQFTRALAALNRAQTRAAMRQILKYHAEIDGLRTQAQERLEWQRRVEQALAEARRLAAEKQLDAALHVLDTVWHGLAGRSLEALGQTLRREYDRLAAERDLAQQIQAAETAFARQDYRQAYDLAGSLSRQHPAREDLRRLHERFGLVWNSLQSRLAGVHEALEAERLDDAVALLASLRQEWPDNPDWRALWLLAHMDYGRAQVATGRVAMGEHRFDQAAGALAGARRALAAALDVFEQHPTAGLERDEAEALQAAATAAAQAARDGSAGRWDTAWRGWQAAGEKLRQAAGVRGRDFGELTAVIESMLGDAAGTVAALEQARLLLAEGQRALAEGDAGRARECFHAGLSQARRGGDDLQAQLQSGLRAAGDAQREARALQARAEHTEDEAQRLALLRRAYERWRTAPEVADRLAGRLVAAARRALANGDEEAAAGYCEQALALPEARGDQLAEAAQLARRSAGRRQAQDAVAEATRSLAELGRQDRPSAAAYRQVLEILTSAPLQEVPELQGMAAGLERQARERYERWVAAEPHLALAEALRQAGHWSEALAALEDAVAAFGEGTGSSRLARRLVAWQAIAGGLALALGKASEALAEAQELYGAAATGELAALHWEGLARALARAAARLAAPPPGAEPLPHAWTDLEARLDDLTSKVALLREVDAQVATGRAVEALPALVRAVAERGRDPVLSAVLRWLQAETAGEAATRAESLAAEAREAVARGEMAQSRWRLAEARLYAPANAPARTAIETLERQVATIERMAQLAPIAGASAAAAQAGAAQAGAADAGALGGYRAALELAAAGDAGFPVAVCQDLRLLLGLEDALWDGEVVGEGETLFRRLVQAAANDSLLRNHLLVRLRGWWKLALRAAAVDFVTARLLVGDPAAAYARAREALLTAPGDAELRDLFVRARQELWARRQAAISRRVARARRLAERGGYTEALAEQAPPHGRNPASGLAIGVEADPASDEALLEGLAAALAEAGELQLDLAEARDRAERLAPIAERARAGLAQGRPDQTAEALEEAGLVDPERRCTTLWRELEAIAALVAARQERAEQARLDELAGRAEAALELCGSSREALAILEQLTEAGAVAGGLAGPEGERLRDRLAALKTGAAAAWERQERLEAALDSARQAGEAGAVAQQIAALERAAALARGRALEAIQAEMARLPAQPRERTGSDRHDLIYIAPPGPAAAPPHGTNGTSRSDGEQGALPMALAGDEIDPQDTEARTVSPAAATSDDGDEPSPSPRPRPGPPSERADGLPELARGVVGSLPAVEAALEVEMLAEFDFDDWLSNVTPVAPEEDGEGRLTA